MYEKIKKMILFSVFFLLCLFFGFASIGIVTWILN